MEQFVPYAALGNPNPPHPAEVDESANLAAVLPRHLPCAEDLRIPIDPPVLSGLQRESLALAYAAFARGRGFLLGDSTGLGKGRVCAATILEAVLRDPMARGVWVTNKQDLYQDSQRDVAAVDSTGVLKWGHNIRFATYFHLQKNTDDYVRWLTPAGTAAVLVFDEVHVANNLDTKAAQGVMAAQQALPRARVLYSSATSASRVDQLGCLLRLGLWGPGCGFETFDIFVEHMKRFGLSAEELLAVYLKREGMFVSRQVSMRGIPMCMHVCHLTAEQRELYDACAVRWAASPAERHQRFFSGLLTAFKTETAIHMAREAVAAGKSVVLVLQSTGGANAMREKQSRGAVMGDVLLQGPPSALRGMLTAADIPNHHIRLPLDPLDRIIQAFGADGVAELTGRTSRAVPVPGQPWWAWAGRPSLNDQRKAFQEDRLHVAVISRAGATGISLHAEHPDSRPRVHITIELPWTPETYVQQCGRAHRANQTSTPEYCLLVSDAPAELRVVSTLAARLHQLGALKHGDRDAGSGELLDMHTCSGVTIPALRRAAIAVGLAENVERSQVERIQHGRIDNALLNRKANTTASRQSTDRQALHVVRALTSSIASSTRASRDLATVVTAVPAACSAALECGVLEARGRLHPPFWTTKTHRYFPQPFRRIVRAVLMAAQAPETRPTLGSIGPDLMLIILGKLAATTSQPGPTTLRLVGPTDRPSERWGRQTLEEFLNDALGCTLAVQQHMVDAVAACALEEDNLRGRAVQTIEEYVLPANSDERFQVHIDEVREVIERDELHVAVRVASTPGPTDQLRLFREAGVLLGARVQLNGQLCCTVRSPEYEGCVDVWGPGRPRRTKRLTTESAELMEHDHAMRADAAGVPVQAYGPDDDEVDKMWEQQANTYRARLECDAIRRSRVCIFVFRNPLVRLDAESRRTVLRISKPELRFTGLLLREQPYLPSCRKRPRGS
jgi:hypothetical protein